MPTCHNRADVPGGLGRCCTGRTVFSGGSCCYGSPPSCGTSLHGSAGLSSDPCSDAGRRGGAGLLATTDCCFPGTCTCGPSASLLCLENSEFFSFSEKRFDIGSETPPYQNLKEGLLFNFSKRLHLSISPLWCHKVNLCLFWLKEACFLHSWTFFGESCKQRVKYAFFFHLLYIHLKTGLIASYIPSFPKWRLLAAL